MGTVVHRGRGNGVNLTYIGTGTGVGGDAGDKYVGLDHFGRVVDHRWADGGVGGTSTASPTPTTGRATA